MCLLRQRNRIYMFNCYREDCSSTCMQHLATAVNEDKSSIILVFLSKLHYLRTLQAYAFKVATVLSPLL